MTTAAADASSTDVPKPSEPPVSAEPPTKAPEAAGGDTSVRSAEDELLNSVGEDELEKLLREMEAEGM